LETLSISEKWFLTLFILFPVSGHEIKTVVEPIHGELPEVE